MPSELITDAVVANHGSISLVHPMTQRAYEWFEEHTPEDAMYVGIALVVEHRYVADLVEGMVGDGLVVK